MQHAGVAIAPGRSSAASSTAFASTVLAPAAGSRVRTSHSCQAVRFISASAYSAATSRSSACCAWTARHRGGVGHRPPGQVLGRLGGREAVAQGLDQRPLDRVPLSRQFGGALDRRCALRSVGAQVDLVERVPCLVVVRAGGVGHAPVRDRATLVHRDRLLEAAHRLLVVEAVGPDQPAVEPALRAGELSGAPPVGAEIERGRRHRRSRRFHALHRQPREHAVQATRELPVGLPEKVHERRDEHGPQDERVEEHGAGEPDTES